MRIPRSGRPARSAGAFLGPDMLIPVPMRTLSDDLDDAPAEPEDDREPEPERPGILRRTVDRLMPGRARPG